MKKARWRSRSRKVTFDDICTGYRAGRGAGQLSRAEFEQGVAALYHSGERRRRQVHIDRQIAAWPEGGLRRSARVGEEQPHQSFWETHRFFFADGRTARGT